MKKTILLAATLAASMGAAAQGQVNIICSVQADWCNMMATVYSRTTGTKVNMSMKGSGEALAQLIAEKDNPKTDIWFGGTGDPHLQAAEQGLTLEYKSPLLPQLYPWARKQAEDAKFRTVGVYLGPVGFGFNTELLARKKAQAPRVMLSSKPAGCSFRRAYQAATRYGCGRGLIAGIGTPFSRTPAPNSATYSSSWTGCQIQLRVVTPARVSATITPKSGLPPAKFLVPSIGSMTNACGAEPSSSTMLGFAKASSSPTIST